MATHRDHVIIEKHLVYAMETNQALTGTTENVLVERLVVLIADIANGGVVLTHKGEAKKIQGLRNHH